MEMQEGLTALNKLLSKYDWFCGVEAEARRYVVYVHHMNFDNTLVPMTMAGKQVVVHFDHYRRAARDQFVDHGESAGWKAPPALIPVPMPPLPEENEEDIYGDTDVPGMSLNDLSKELTKLEKVCGSNILQDIFYEIHDGKNAITHNSAKFPDVRDRLLELYKTYGFDVIYEELDG